MEPPTAPGWFGKIASLGDFAQRRLPPACVRACDAWLSASMRAGAEQLGESRWIDAYLQAPVLRFGWAPGVLDASWWFGVLIPSCDSVGRYFPLLVAQPRARAPEDRIALDHLELWLDHVADAALQTLGERELTIDAFDALLHEAPPWPGPAARIAAGPAPLSRRMQQLAARRLTQQLAGHTLWWRSEAPEIEIMPGLPDGPRFAALITQV